VPLLRRAAALRGGAGGLRLGTLLGRRWLQSLGFTVTLLPPQYVRAYVRRNKTDRADADALLEAARCADLAAVPVKSGQQQALGSLHRLRSGWLSTRASRINLRSARPSLAPRGEAPGRRHCVE